MKEFLEYTPEVEDALARRKALVALESTIISHGMPYPENLTTAREVEQAVRDNGAVPATLAMRRGKILVGLSDDDLNFFAEGKDILKASRRDFARVLSGRRDAAVTVAASMICANLAGLQVFATGGVGGVHRGAETSFDISADLEELARTPVIVVCAGVKSILNIPGTLEYLETKGVPVFSVGTREFPSFYSRQSGCFLEHAVQGAREIADIWLSQQGLGFPSGLLIANPIPEKDAMDTDEIDRAITEAIRRAGDKKIIGKDITPYLLSEIVRITGGKSLKANIALVKNNAVLAARIAAALAAEK